MRPFRTPRVTLLGLLLLAATADAAGPPVKLHGLSHAAFEKLPPDALLDVGGRTETKGQLLSRLKPAAAAKLAPASVLDEAAAKIDREDKAKMDQANANVIARVRPAPPPGPRLGPSSPRITEVPYPAGPGHLVLVFGSGFGRTAGEVLIAFEEGDPDRPLIVGGKLPGSVSRVLKSDRAWADDQVVAYVPPGVSGVTDKTAHLVVVTADGKRSAPAPIGFTAARQVRFLPASVKNLIPDQGGCDTFKTDSIGCQYAVSNFFVWHMGKDEVRADPRPLKNGWKRLVTRYEGSVWGSMPGCTGVIEASPVIPPFDGPLIVSWITDGYADFTVSYVVVGPRGTEPQ